MLVLDIFVVIISGVVFYQFIKCLDKRADRLERAINNKQKP